MPVNSNVDTNGLLPRVRDVMTDFQLRFPQATITSGYRDPNYNKGVDGAKDSRHMHKDAFDFKWAPGTPDSIRAQAVDYFRAAGVGGMGTYNKTGDSFHVDWRQKAPAAWGPNRSWTSLDQTPAWFQKAAMEHRAGQSPKNFTMPPLPEGAVSPLKIMGAPPQRGPEPQGYTAFGGQDSPRDRGNLPKNVPQAAPQAAPAGPMVQQGAPQAPAGVLSQQFAPQGGAPQASGLIGQMMANPGARNFAFAGQPGPTQWGSPNYQNQNPWGGGLIQKIAEAIGLKQPDGWGVQPMAAGRMMADPMTTGSIPQGAPQYVPAPQGYAGFGGDDSPRDRGNLSKALPQRAVGGLPARPVNPNALSGFDAQVSPQQFLGSDDVSRFPAGMRNNNPGNLKYSGSKWQQSHYPGMIGPSVNKDEGSPQIVFNSPQSGMQAMSNLIKTKTDQGMTSVYDLINNKNGWTPTAAGPGAARNIAATMGVDPNARLDFSDPKVFANFQKALISQEHGPQGKLYHGLVDEAVARALGTQPSAPSAAPQAAAQPAPAPTPAPQAATPTPAPALPAQASVQPLSASMGGFQPMQRADVGFGQRQVPQGPAALFEQMKANGGGAQFASLTPGPVQALNRDGQPIRQIPIDGAPAFNPNPVTANPDVPAATRPAPVTPTPAPAMPENPLVVRGIRPHTEPPVPLPPQRPAEFAAMPQPVPLPPQRPPEFNIAPQPQPMPQRAEYGLYPRTDAPDPHSWPVGGMNPQQMAQLAQMQGQQPGIGGWFNGLFG